MKYLSKSVDYQKEACEPFLLTSRFQAVDQEVTKYRASTLAVFKWIAMTGVDVGRAIICNINYRVNI